MRIHPLQTDFCWIDLGIACALLRVTVRPEKAQIVATSHFVCWFGCHPGDGGPDGDGGLPANDDSDAVSAVA